MNSTCKSFATWLVLALVLVRFTFIPAFELPLLDIIVGGNIRF